MQIRRVIIIATALLLLGMVPDVKCDHRVETKLQAVLFWIWNFLLGKPVNTPYKTYVDYMRANDWYFFNESTQTLVTSNPIPDGGTLTCFCNRNTFLPMQKVIMLYE